MEHEKPKILEGILEGAENFDVMGQEAGGRRQEAGGKREEPILC
jgi:hypothetical protein